VPLSRPSQWRLTDRGIALVLVTGLLIVTAALAVMGLTAARVTGERYSGVGHSVLAQP
jgi:Tfp pilus assembly protein PilX